MISSKFTGYLMEKFHKKHLIFVGLLMGSFCYIMMGPDPITKIHPSFAILVICYFFLGIVSSLTFIPTMPEYIEDLARMYP